MALKLYTSVEKWLKQKFSNFQGLIPTFPEVTGEKLVGGRLFAPLPLILYRVKAYWFFNHLTNVTSREK